ncbi:MAG: hypothetical protein KAU03_04945 [Candidatus Altiarchaeales archaeon]|nr:hypothetical protein [Candidatus Altiarchaeales archaeon]
MIINGKKDIEVRKWGTSFRGPMFIHSSRSVDLDACEMFNIDPKTVLRGYLVGTGKLSEIRNYRRKREFVADQHRHLNPPKWFERPRFGWVIERARIIVPVKYSGKLGLFDVDERFDHLF